MKTRHGRRGDSIDRTYQHLRTLILEHKLRRGSKIRSTEIAAALRVSRTPIRQALERLVQEGFVVKTPSRGYYVAEMGIKEIEDIYGFRMAIELYALTVATNSPVPRAAIAKLEEIQRRYWVVVADSAAVTHAPTDIEFHLALASLAENAYLVKQLAELNDRLRFRRQYDGYSRWAARNARGFEAADQHDRIIAALKVGDGDRAVAELRNHISSAWLNYQRFLDSPPIDTASDP